MSKKIIPLVSLIVIALLVVATIVMACVPKSYAPIECEPARIVVGSMDGRVFDKSNDDDKKVFNAIYDNYVNAFKESSINALFNGRISMGAEVEYYETVTKISSLGTNYVMFNFDKAQTVKVEDAEYSYTKMVIVLESTNVMKTVKAYLYNDDTFTSGTNYYISAIGNLQKLVDYVEDLK